MWCGLVVLMASSSGGTVGAHDEEERLIGWMGETHSVGDGADVEPNAVTAAAQDRERGTWVEPVSWHPRAFVLHNILSPDECDQVLAIARPRMRRSTVIDSVTGESKVDPIRTSEQTFLNRGVYPIVTKIENRLARFTYLPPYHGEDLQVLKYGYQQKYDAHHDVGELDSKSGLQLAKEGGHRVGTVLLYLSDVEEGGETAFPDSEWINPNRGNGETWSECAEERVAVKPKKGDGLLFWSITPEGVRRRKNIPYHTYESH